ncbi:PAS domain-containing protein [Archangium violaceum]|uniref:two-component system sensor histidine kinase NtrB n=1 Tax=Archangium violaceum TaxID=83451 RepID=UPI00193C793B|nr:ATP-binding protein [Archangium violaceum]QRK07066.1 PAS domain-containing protein [Archangium violaceum]
MSQGPRVGFVERLDGFLSEPLRRASPLELGRARMLVGVCWGLLACDALIMLQALLNPVPRSIIAVGVACAVGFGGALVLLRWSSSTRPLALLLCLLLTAGLITNILSMKELVMATHASIMLVPVVSVYLLGRRLGLLFSLSTCVCVGIVFPLHTWGTLEGPGPVLCSFAAVYVLCAWAMSWLFVSSRDETQAMVERMVRTLRESEGQLVSLIESTDDLVLSLDAEGRVITANRSARQLFRRVMGRELQKGEPGFSEFPVEERARWLGFMARAMRGERVKEEMLLPPKERQLTVELTVSPVRGEEGRVVGTTLFGRDITARKEAEARLSEMHRNLLDVSRQAGMAEIATGVLHNVGNALNSVNVSAGVVTERLHGLRVPAMSRAAELLEENAVDLGSFLTTDSRGRQFPVYLKALARRLTEERDAVLEEMRTLCQNLDHIKAVVSMQQAHASSSGMMELLPIPELLDDAIRLHALSFEKVGIEVRREYAQMPPVWVDRHKLLQILLNLVSNARHALLEAAREDKLLTLRVGPGLGGRLRIEVEDNGVGVVPENLPRLFTQGFTTKRDGHGFGLHISALAAEEMRGALFCTSAGQNRGATFTLELPTRDASLVEPTRSLISSGALEAAAAR